MTSLVWIKLLTFVGSLVLFISSWLAQRWVKKQAADQEHVAKDLREARLKAEQAGKAPAPTGYIDEAELNLAIAERTAKPYFDKWVFRSLWIGFLITTIASGWDLVDGIDSSRCRCVDQQQAP